MKCLMTMLVAAVSLLALAQEPAAEGAARPRVGRRVMTARPSIEPVLRAAMNPKIAEKVAITEEQAAKLKVLADEIRALKPLHEKVRQGTERQVELLKAEKIDEAAVPALLAATVALAVVFPAWLSTRSGRGEEAVKGAIELLCEMDGFADPDTGDFTTAELLLAWQEAPCLDVL